MFPDEGVGVAGLILLFCAFLFVLAAIFLQH